MAKDRLITPSYCFILAANFLLYFGFWLLIPVLPFYLSEFFQTGNSTIGIVLSCYTVAALCIRPFSRGSVAVKCSINSAKLPRTVSSWSLDISRDTVA